MPRLTQSDIQRSIEIGIGAAMIVVPWRLRWSRRSVRLLSGIGIALVASTLLPVKSRGHRTRLLRSCCSSRDVIAGAVLVAVQYQLTDEESSVRGIIAGVGESLILLGLATRWSGAAEGSCGDIP